MATLKNLGNNKWKLIVSCGCSGPTGKQVRKTKTITASSERKAKRELSLFESQVINEFNYRVLNNVNINITFSEFIKIWQEKYLSHLSPNTQFSHNIDVKIRLLPYFGSMFISEITTNDISIFLSNIKNNRINFKFAYKPISDATIHHTFRVMRSIFNKAVEWNYIRKNPCNGLTREERPVERYAKKKIYQENELATFFKELDQIPENYTNIKNKLIIYLAFYNMMRRGEIYGLSWENIDFNTSTISIENNAYKIKAGEEGLKKPKTDESIRITYINPKVKELLQQYKEMQENTLKKSNLLNPTNRVFISTRKLMYVNVVTPLDLNSVRSWLRRFCLKIKIPFVGLHAFRHMGATYSLANGTDLVTVQKFLGHTNIETTSLYLHEVESKQRAAANNLLNNIEKLKTVHQNTENAND